MQMSTQFFYWAVVLELLAIIVLLLVRRVR
jgi:hypothetical protein